MCGHQLPVENLRWWSLDSPEKTQHEAARAAQIPMFPGRWSPQCMIQFFGVEPMAFQKFNSFFFNTGICLYSFLGFQVSWSNPRSPSLLGWHLTTVARKLLHGFPHARTTVFPRLRGRFAGIGIVDPLHAFIARSWCIHYSHSSTYSYVQYSLCIFKCTISIYITCRQL